MYNYLLYGGKCPLTLPFPCGERTKPDLSTPEEEGPFQNKFKYIVAISIPTVPAFACRLTKTGL
jgi:hypothetical protein